MSKVKIDLGKATFIDSKANVKIQSQSILRLQSNDFELCKAVSTEGFVPYDDDLWIHSHRPFLFSFSMTFDHYVNDSFPNVQDLRRWLPHILAQAELWKQLGFKDVTANASVDELPTPNEPFTTDLNLNIPDWNLSNSTKRSQEKPNGPDSYNLYCPDLVRYATLQQVQLHMRFILPAIESCIDREPPSSLTCHRRLRGHTHENGHNNRRIPKAYGSEYLQRHTILGLVDAALRTCICKQVPRLTKGVSRIHVHSKSLQEVIPTLFLPGYTIAVSQRHFSISRVSRSLENCLGRSLQTFDHSKLPQNDTSTNLQPFIWRALINGVQQTCHAKALKALSLATQDICMAEQEECMVDIFEFGPSLAESTSNKRNLFDMLDSDKGNVTSCKNRSQHVPTQVPVDHGLIVPGTREELDPELKIGAGSEEDLVERHDKMLQEQHTFNNKSNHLPSFPKALSDDLFDVAHSVLLLDDETADEQYIECMDEWPFSPSDPFSGSNCGSTQLSQGLTRSHPPIVCVGEQDFTEQDSTLFEGDNVPDEPLNLWKLFEHREVNSDLVHCQDEPTSPRLHTFGTNQFFNPSRASCLTLESNSDVCRNMWGPSEHKAHESEDEMLEMTDFLGTEPDVNQFEDTWSPSLPTRAATTNGSFRRRNIDDLRKPFRSWTFQASENKPSKKLLTRERSVQETPNTSPISASPSGSLSRAMSQPTTLFKKLSRSQREPSEADLFDIEKTISHRHMEIKSRKTVEDYEMRDASASEGEEDEDEMLFR